MHLAGLPQAEQETGPPPPSPAPLLRAPKAGALACSEWRTRCSGPRTRWGCSRKPGVCTASPAATRPTGTPCCWPSPPWGQDRRKRKLSGHHNLRSRCRASLPGQGDLRTLFCGLSRSSLTLPATPASFFFLVCLLHPKRCSVAFLNPKIMLDYK